MPLSDPRQLRLLLARYADLRIAQVRGERRRPGDLEELVATLCAVTGTAHIDEAVAAADALLAETGRPARRARTAPGAAPLLAA
ncbi:DUF5133 domain-containing protein [Streptomyces sp. LP05-1]|uniref:DUF5133 domain-containing protein n=1 Tax=Streptomyces pyxinae TaxID=2970734 RepID=A0ABT2CHL5_9ACTN|nr:DUF5133 domain-containing protein [Streptomyces sp. LP05-1]MCS0636888.1 DUF5133 domain-containing protein [Streptomyces sp. LP05-1]